MTEDYLHYIWKFQKFDHVNLETTEGEPVLIKKTGTHNDDAGPDFSEANVIIDGTEWFGSVEIHIRSSDWKKHNHQTDRAYNNVVLHVVYEDDGEVLNENGETIPTVELKLLIDHDAYFQYERFLQNGTGRPCQGQIQTVPKLTIINELDEMLVNRLLRKSHDIQELLVETGNNWEEVFHQLLFKYLGMKVNASPMFSLSKKVSYSLLQKNANDLKIAEALLFGQAGMLKKEGKEDYYRELRSEYLFLKQKYNLSSMTGAEWKFSRMRPPNFPTLRIAQLAAIYSSYQNLFQVIRDKTPLRHLQMIFGVQPSEYWQHHYSFKSLGDAKKHKGNLGKVALQNIIINVIVPFAFFYGRAIGDKTYEDYALLLLSSIPGENNKITRKFEDLEIGVLSAKDSQALIQLHDELCINKRCLNCKIGVYLVQS
ncbi:DUF2851 family protein [Parvicella tangerina]|uniref:DUF2851 family protein n=1 Tax=Parvicella tangerina TaxID=2829795 RepID=A0A916NFL2_9FLAO|nr:DUF2851 family protein [Parvicella tangerina]CAG5078120.1 hypothetical protein CRYO30217_00582 [Parvicella tangerina]